MRISDWSSDVCSSDLGGHRLVQINVAPFDAVKHGAEPVVADARLALEALGEANAGHCVPPAWSDRLTALGKTWAGEAATVLAAPLGDARPSDAQVIGAVEIGRAQV